MNLQTPLMKFAQEQIKAIMEHYDFLGIYCLFCLYRC